MADAETTPRRPVPRWAAVAAAVVVTVTLTVFAAVASQHPATRPLPRADHVVIFGVPGLQLDDIASPSMPALSALAARGALGELAADTAAKRPSSDELYVSMGASARALPATAASALEAPGDGNPACPTSNVAVPGIAAARARTRSLHSGSRAGALGDAVARAGRIGAVVGVADSTRLDGRAVTYRPAPLAIMTSDGCVPEGSVDDVALLRADRGAPSGRAVDVDAFAATTRAAVAAAAVTVVDPGETDRALRVNPPVSASSWRAALARTDAVLGRVAANLPPRTVLIVVGLDVRGPARHLAPIVIASDDSRPARVWSPSTGRLDLATLADVAPTALQSLGLESPAGMVGRPVALAGGQARLADLRHSDAWSHARDDATPGLTDAIAALMAAVALLVVLAAGDRGSVTRAGGRLAGVLAIVLASTPLASLLTALVPLGAPTPQAFAATTALLALGAATVAAAATRRPTAAIAWLAGLALAILVGDLLTGSRLQVATFFGTSDAVAARFRGLGNAALGIVGGAYLVVLAHASRRRTVSVGVAMGVGAVLVVIAVLPPFGAKVGAVPTLVPAFALAALALAGRRPSGRVVVLTVLAAAAVLAVAVVVDVAVGRGNESHLGRLVGAVGHNGDTLFVTVARKASTALRVLAHSTWTLPTAALASVTAIAVTRLPRRTSIPRTTCSLAVVAVALAALAVAVNDSGILAAATALLLYGSYLLAATIETDDEKALGRGRPTPDGPGPTRRVAR